MIAHIDADAFFASVLQRKHPELRDKPLLALGMGGGCVIAASYEAKAKGVRTGMSLHEAIRLCPKALSMPSDFRETGIASRQIEEILRDCCPIIEQMSIDEWYLDLRTLPGGLPGDLRTWATGMQQQIRRLTGLSVSVGVAPGKLLAKMASEYRKPAGVTVVPHETIEQFLRDRPAAAIPGIGRQRSIHTDIRGWKTAWDIAAAVPGDMERLFGKVGKELQQELNGQASLRLVSEPPPPKSISRCRSFRATTDADTAWAHLLQHLTYITLKLRRHGLACRGVSVWLRDRDYRSMSTHATSETPLTTEESLLPLLERCFRELTVTGNRMAFTQAGAGLWRLSPVGSEQCSLFRPPTEGLREGYLQGALDRIRDKFGRDVLSRGSALRVNERKRMTVDRPLFDMDDSARRRRAGLRHDGT